MSSAEENSVDYWKARCGELDAELTEFQEMSKQFEAELESNLNKTESLLAEQRKRADRAEAELTTLRESAALHLAQRSDSGAGLQAQLRAVEAQRDQLKSRVLELETSHDALEQRSRQLDATLASVSADLERAIEERALLSVDLDVQREHAQADLQRARDELRDALSEIARLQQQQQQSSAPSLSPPLATAAPSSATLLAESMLATIRSLQQMLLK